MNRKRKTIHQWWVRRLEAKLGDLTGYICFMDLPYHLLQEDESEEEDDEDKPRAAKRKTVIEDEEDSD